MDEVFQKIDEYLKNHPDIEKLLKQFNISREQYEKFISLTSTHPKEITDLTTQGTYNANISGLSKQY